MSAPTEGGVAQLWVAEEREGEEHSSERARKKKTCLRRARPTALALLGVDYSEPLRHLMKCHTTRVLELPASLTGEGDP